MLWLGVRKILMILFVCLLTVSGVVLAETTKQDQPPPPVQGIGQMADSLMEVTVVASNFIGTICIILGSSFLFASLIKYMQYRENPLAVPISTVVLLVVMGIFLVCLPLAYKLTGHGIPFSIH